MPIVPEQRAAKHRVINVFPFSDMIKVWNIELATVTTPGSPMIAGVKTVPGRIHNATVVG